jgi:hypothetical protein
VLQRRTIHTNSQLVLEDGFLPKKKKEKLAGHILGKYPDTRIVPEYKVQRTLK